MDTKFPTVIHGDETPTRCINPICEIELARGDTYKISPEGPLCVPCGQVREFELNRARLRAEKASNVNQFEVL